MNDWSHFSWYYLKRKNAWEYFKVALLRQRWNKSLEISKYRNSRHKIALNIKAPQLTHPKWNESSIHKNRFKLKAPNPITSLAKTKTLPFTQYMILGKNQSKLCHTVNDFGFFLSLYVIYEKLLNVTGFFALSIIWSTHE